MKRFLIGLGLAACVLVVLSPLVLAAPDTPLPSRQMTPPRQMMPPRQMTPPRQMMPPRQMVKPHKMVKPAKPLPPRTATMRQPGNAAIIQQLPK